MEYQYDKKNKQLTRYMSIAPYDEGKKTDKQLRSRVKTLKSEGGEIVIFDKNINPAEWEHLGGINEQLAFGNDYEKVTTVCVPKILHDYFTKYRKFLEDELLADNSGNIEYLFRGDDLETRMQRRLFVDLKIIDIAFSDNNLKDSALSCEQFKDSYKKAHYIYFSKIRKTFENKDMSLFQGLAAFKARNVLISSEMSSDNLIFQLENRNQNEIFSNLDTKKVVFYIRRYLQEQLLSFRYATAIEEKFSKDENGKKLISSQSTLDEIHSQFLRSKQKTRVVFNLLKQINFEDLEQKSKTSESFISFEEPFLSLKEKKELLLDSFDKEKLHTYSWERIDSLGGKLKVDQVDNNRLLAIRKQLKLF